MAWDIYHDSKSCISRLQNIKLYMGLIVIDLVQSNSIEHNLHCFFAALSYINWPHWFQKLKSRSRCSYKATNMANARGHDTSQVKGLQVPGHKIDACCALVRFSRRNCLKRHIHRIIPWPFLARSAHKINALKTLSPLAYLVLINGQLS